MRIAGVLAFGLAAIALVPAFASASTRYDPRLRFHTISTPRFDIHFHQGEETQARRLAEIAEDVAARLDATLGRPSGRVQVILVDQTDLPNGWATPLPYGLMEITAAGPGGESLIGHTDDWLRLVFAHEYTHIVHLDRGRGWPGALRRVFGRLPLLYPNLFQPLWLIEGVATFEETAITGQGRLHAGDFRLIAERAAASAKFLSIDRAGGGLIDWPSGHAPYVYGGLFHEYLARTYGEESLERLTNATARRLPYFGSRAFREVFDKPLGDLWKEFESHAARRHGGVLDSVTATRLTRHGFNVVGPRFSRDGRLYYSTVNPHEFPALMSLDPGGGRPTQVTRRYLGSKLGFAGDEIVFDQLELIQNVGLQSDLYATRPDGRGVRRLTRDARAADPDASPDNVLVFTVQRADGRGLSTMGVPPPGQLGTPRPLVAEAMTDWSSPRWSPDGKWIAAERRRLGGPSEIALVDPSSGATTVLVASAERRNVTPAWTPDGQAILFAASRNAGGFEIHSVDVATGSVTRLDDTGPSAHAPDVSAEGSTLVYVGYTVDGDDLFSMPLATATWRPLARDAEPPSRAAETASPAAGRPYSPWATLVPRFWVPTIESDSGELVVGAATAGYDALGRHAVFVEAGWTAARARPDWQVAYAYDRWWPTLFADFSEDTDPFRGSELRSREANAGALFPVRRVRWSQSFLSALHSSSDLLVRPAGDGRDDVRSVRRALRAGWLVDAARSYGYSIGEEEGWSAQVALELTRAALGASGDGGSATIDVRGYLPLGPRHAVLAARGSTAAAWGHDAVRRVFSASGSGPQPRGFRFDADAIGLIRGVPESALTGDRAVVVNLDYRVPLARIERGAGTVPFFARTVHAAFFADVGHAWTGSFRAADVTRALGAELSLDAVVGHVAPLTFTGGVAWRAGPARSGAVVFGRIGRAF